MSNSKKALRRRWLRIPVWAWLVSTVLVIAGVAVYHIFFVRRDVLEFRPVHTFSVADAEFFGSAHALGDPLPIPGNKIKLLQNGDQSFGEMLDAIREARQTINFEAFLFHSGHVGDQFRDAFIERAKSGVEVRILFDGLGSGTSLKNSDVKLMEQGGCRVAYYHPARSWRIDRINRRSHRRVLVVDGKIGFTGGIGFADQWAGNASGPNEWRDVQAQIEGPLVAKLQGAFQQHWIAETGEALSGVGQFPALEPAGKVRAQMIASHAFSYAAVPLMQAVAIAAAERRICISNAYCTPNDDQVELLVAAVRRGVSVELLLPGKHNDQPATQAAGRTAYGKLLEGGVQIYEYAPTMLHSKTMVVDGLFAVVGSSNLDSRSAAINEELDITVYDPDFGREMEAVFDRDLKNSRVYGLDEFRRRSVWERGSEALMAPFHSQL